MTLHVAVVGAGASGVLAAARLLEAGATVTLVGDEPAGRGAAYRTTDPGHLLNVPACGMSADPGRPDDLVAWAGCAPYTFLPRAVYSDYLRAHLAAAGGDLRCRQERLDSPDGIRADAVVLALGNAGPQVDWAPGELLTSPAFVADPWAAPIPPDGDVLLVGSGLTAVDLALSLADAGRRVHAVSRSGVVPQAHAVEKLPAFRTPDLSGVRGLPALRVAVHAHLAAAQRETGDWRPGMDSLRPLTSSLWASLCLDERREFARVDARPWNTHRHRMAPATAARLAAHQRSGRVTVSAGELLSWEDGTARLSDGSSLRVGVVVNCAGPSLSASAHPLIGTLIAQGRAAPGPLGWGLDTDEHGRVRPVAGVPVRENLNPASGVGTKGTSIPSRESGPALWTLGPLRRGALWETTAIPEIRCQARDLAQAIVQSQLCVDTGLVAARPVR